MFRNIGLTAMLAMGMFAGAAQAEEHYVVMMGAGYFPNQIFVQAGDTVRFVNNSQFPMSATAVDQSWDTGILEANDVVVVDVVDGMTGTFMNVVQTNYAYGNQIGADAQGVLNFMSQQLVRNELLSGDQVGFVDN